MAELVATVAALTSAGIKLAEVTTKLGRLLLDAEADMNVKNDVESLKKELSWMHCFLKDAENKPGSRNSNVFQMWVTEVSQLATECEVVADQISLLTLEQLKTSHTGCLSLNSCISYKAELCRTDELSGQIRKLLSDIQSISSRRSRYDPNADAGNSSGTKIVDENLMQLRRSAPYANNEHMVGQNEAIENLTGKFMNKDSGQFVISILGMGGLGKTTLARKLYNTFPERHFTSRAWICVSQEYNISDILMSLINSMATPSRQKREAFTTISLMEEYLRSYISRHRFLVVVDDIWEKTAWESLERAFLDIKNGSKVIITTRNEHVAVLNNAYVHRLRYLDEDESWELFCKKALPSGTECPSNMKEIGKAMVAKCSGLPLAIVVLGGILFKKPLAFSKWREVRENLWKELEKNSVHINAILTLSFNDMPLCLKSCFLYVTMFPKHFEISR